MPMQATTVLGIKKVITPMNTNPRKLSSSMALSSKNLRIVCGKRGVLSIVLIALLLC